MKPSLRYADTRDAEAIAAIADSALAASIAPDSPRLRRILAQKRTLVAAAAGEVLGFCDSFLTENALGEPRLELDLLAVAPSARGIGIGSALVAAAVIRAERLGASTLRALVRTSNAPMRAICRRAGLARSQSVGSLNVCWDSAAPSAPSAARSAHLIPVETLIYSGIWLEGNLSQPALDAAEALRRQKGAELTGTVLPHGHAEAAELLRANGFQALGDYHWWSLTL